MKYTYKFTFLIWNVCCIESGFRCFIKKFGVVVVLIWNIRHNLDFVHEQYPLFFTPGKGSLLSPAVLTCGKVCAPACLDSAFLS